MRSLYWFLMLLWVVPLLKPEWPEQLNEPKLLWHEAEHAPKSQDLSLDCPERNAHTMSNAGRPLFQRTKELAQQSWCSDVHWKVRMSMPRQRTPSEIHIETAGPSEKWTPSPGLFCRGQQWSDIEANSSQWSDNSCTSRGYGVGVRKTFVPVPLFPPS